MTFLTVSKFYSKILGMKFWRVIVTEIRLKHIIHVFTVIGIIQVITQACVLFSVKTQLLFTSKFEYRPNNCTEDDLSTISKQLPAVRCKGTKPFFQSCSFTQATKCPDATWIESYYKSHTKNLELKSSTLDEFVAVYVGCNKGFDAVNALRMGTKNPRYNKKDWSTQMNTNAQNVCKQNEGDFDLGSSEAMMSPRKGIVHCIEPMPQTADRLQLSASSLNWDNELIVTKAAIGQTPGLERFPKYAQAGIENQGFDSCAHMKKKKPKQYQKFCEDVPVYTLDGYLANSSRDIDTSPINILSIDVEGYDFDVMLGGQKTLMRTEYLEFEYNWMGSWGKQKLMDAVSMLDEHGFTCYWAGENLLWRLDASCWLDHYSYHSWSNVACVHRQRLPEVAVEMESVFKNTLKMELNFG